MIIDTHNHQAPEGRIAGTPLTGQHALVTGATRGIGAAIARTLGNLGADLTLIGRDRSGLDARAAEIVSASDVRVQIEIANVSDAGEIRSAFDSGVRANGAVSILVNNAGSGKSAPFHKMDQDLWNFIIGVNLTGAFLCTQQAIGGMLEASYGRIINVASTAGLTGYEYVSAYCAAKHGVVGLTRSLALETATKGITVNAVCPGYTETDLIHETIDNIVAKTGRSKEDARAELTASNPQRRLVQPWEVAETVAWLALPSSASITGQAVAIAGGEVM
ncbi:MAG: putative ketoacyl reductase [Alphaproteobacteria bacterium MarineAlpha11_Bin1]|nr:MAG: putative ketoacyl reductase [Alphaproteobacteria bacterium MarineAlpha11_Bin1]|tara:strand:+ start:12828 stop:13655 length:828 start_codon:yes stop_codon:yes gene_type:complete